MRVTYVAVSKYDYHYNYDNQPDMVIILRVLMRGIFEFTVDIHQRLNYVLGTGVVI